MRIFFILASSVLLLIPAALNAEIDFGISATDEGIESFYLSISDHYKVPQHEVKAVHARHIPDEELPVVFFFATHAHVSPSTIIDLRLRHKTWNEISVHYGLTPEIYYVPVENKKFDPYSGQHHGKAYGHYKNQPHKKDWRKLKLSDSEVVDLVNLKFMSEYHQYAPEKIIQMRGKGKKFHVINNDIAKYKRGHKDERGKDEWEKNEWEHDYYKKDDFKPKNKHKKKPGYMYP